MNILCESCPLRTKSVFRQLTVPELEFVSALKQDQKSFATREDIIRPGQSAPGMYTLYAGWAFRYLRLADGKRQIVAILLPGDLIGLQWPMLGRLTHSVQALTPVSVCVLDAARLEHMLANLTEMTRNLIRTLVDDQLAAENQVAMLQRSAAQRIAFLMLDIFERLRRRGMANGSWCPFPLQRQHLADATGLSGAHVNRSLALLRSQGLATLENNTLVLNDLGRLADYAGYETPHALERCIL